MSCAGRPTEDFSYTLVMRASGRQYRVYGTPVWTSDKKRFLTVACSWIPPRGTLTIQAPANGELATEAEVPLPTCLDETETCAARWDNPSWIAVTCTRADGSSRRGSEFVVMRGKRRRLEDVRALEAMTCAWTGQRADLQVARS